MSTHPTNRDAGPAVGHAPQRLSDLLLAGQLVTQAQLAEAQAESEASGEFLCKVLVQREFVTQDQINTCFVKLCKIPHISLLDYEISPDVLALIPQDICLHYGLLPIDKLGRILTVAMVDPLDTDALARIRAYCPELRIKPILCNWAHFEQVSRKYFAAADARKSGENASMASFGLSSLPPKPVAKPAPAAPPATPPASEGDTASRPAVDASELVGAMQEGLREVARELAAQRAPSAPQDQTPGVSAEVLAEVMRGSVRDAMAEALQTLERPAAPDPPGGEQGGPANAPVLPVEAIGEAIRESMQDAVATAVVQLRANQPPEPAAPPVEAFAETLRQTLGGVMEEAMAAVVVQARASAAPAESGAAMQEAMIGAMREVIDSSRQALESQGARLAELAEAAVQSTQQTSQLVEASLVQREREGNLRSSKRARHASVSPFGAMPAGDAGDEQHAAEDGAVRDALEAEVPLESLTFESFYPGKANAFTVQVSQSVAQSPGAEFNPFFLYGNVGLGKTHLISAAGNYIQQHQPKHRVGYVSASHFSRRLKEALAADAQDAFRENYCHWDVLILDDIQFMGGRVEAQEEFFHIFNVLHQQGRQIIIAGDKAPDRLGLLEQRLISRFSSGIVAELKPPEWETRMQILKHHVAASNATLPEEVCSLIAMRVAGDMRKMVGALRKVLAFASLSGERVTVELTSEILSHLGGEEAA